MEENPINRQLVPLAIVVAGGLIAIAIYFGGSGSSATPLSNSNPTDTPETKVLPVTNKDHIIGSRNADVVVVEYSDTECPYCKVFHQTMHQIVDEYQGRVAWVYRHFPIVQLHSRAPKEAEATECANELGGNQVFWTYIDRVFQITNSNNSLDPTELPKIATTVGLDEATFNDCLSSGKYTNFIEKSVEEAKNTGALGTPYSVILSKDKPNVIINGAEPIESVRSKIEAVLQ